MIRRFVPGIAALLLAGCASVAPPATVPSVDLSRYAGEWHEIESFPNWFQRGCAATRAIYTPAADGRIRVQNCLRRGRLDSIGDRPDRAGSNNAKLKVRFFWPFEGDYWILDLDRDYRWAAVGTPDRRFLWILSREADLDPAVLDGIRGRLAAQGYDVGRLQPTPR